MILKLIDCIEWNTGRICRKRDKKSMTKSMLSAFKYRGFKTYINY